MADRCRTLRIPRQSTYVFSDRYQEQLSAAVKCYGLATLDVTSSSREKNGIKQAWSMVPEGTKASNGKTCQSDGASDREDGCRCCERNVESHDTCNSTRVLTSKAIEAMLKCKLFPPLKCSNVCSADSDKNIISGLSYKFRVQMFRIYRLCEKL